MAATRPCHVATCLRHGRDTAATRPRHGVTYNDFSRRGADMFHSPYQAGHHAASRVVASLWSRRATLAQPYSAPYVWSVNV
eukprot:1903772-Prymnesium_polylepis.1